MQVFILRELLFVIWIILSFSIINDDVNKVLCLGLNNDQIWWVKLSGSNNKAHYSSSLTVCYRIELLMEWIRLSCCCYFETSNTQRPLCPNCFMQEALLEIRSRLQSWWLERRLHWLCMTAPIVSIPYVTIVSLTSYSTLHVWRWCVLFARWGSSGNLIWGVITWLIVWHNAQVVDEAQWSCSLTKLIVCVRGDASGHILWTEFFVL